jgi:hypothetical protein
MRFLISESGKADACQLIGQCAGGFVVVRTALHIQRPLRNGSSGRFARSATVAAEPRGKVPCVFEVMQGWI